MKVFGIVMKILAALAAVAGIVYIVATYGDKIVAWAKGMLAKLNCCCGDCCCDEDCCCEEEDCCCGEECCCEEAAPTEEAPAEETDFEG